VTASLWQLLAVLAAAGSVLVWPRRRRELSARGTRRRPGRPLRAAAGWSGRSDALGQLSAPDRRVPPDVPVAVVIELVAAALSAGLPPADAIEATARAAGGGTAGQLRPVIGALRLGAATEVAWARAGGELEPLVLALVLAERTGASTATALRRTASDERAARRRRAQVAARRLGVQLVLPLGLATLPAFALLAVVPVLIGLALQVLA
jgi:tight adherence protein B